uniref:Uncharacterized protein n=1 Tax=Solanum lycopersicum TaxID=4081 RepID=A0A3Q7I5R5_SOLLC
MFKLEPRAKIPAFTPYLIVLPKTEELRKQSKKLLHVVTLAHQRHSLDGLLCLCIDYRHLISKNKFRILLIVDLFDRLGKAKYFTKLDPCKG